MGHLGRERAQQRRAKERQRMEVALCRQADAKGMGGAHGAERGERPVHNGEGSLVVGGAVAALSGSWWSHPGCGSAGQLLVTLDQLAIRACGDRATD